jgi:hypothetical protein
MAMASADPRDLPCGLCGAATAAPRTEVIMFRVIVDSFPFGVPDTALELRSLYARVSRHDKKMLRKVK